MYSSSVKRLRDAESLAIFNIANGLNWKPTIWTDSRDFAFMSQSSEWVSATPRFDTGSQVFILHWNGLLMITKTFIQYTRIPSTDNATKKVCTTTSLRKIQITNLQGKRNKIPVSLLRFWVYSIWFFKKVNILNWTVIFVLVRNVSTAVD